jgi:hypothetical protein
VAVEMDHFMHFGMESIKPIIPMQIILTIKGQQIAAVEQAVSTTIKQMVILD